MTAKTAAQQPISQARRQEQVKRTLRRNVFLQVTGAVGWRKDNIKYKKNEIYLDIVEEVNLMMSSTGQVLRSDVNGKIVMKVFLSGMPDVKLGLNEKLDVSRSTLSAF